MFSRRLPENEQYETRLGKVVEVYPDTWEVDLESEDGGIVYRALVIGPRLPEANSFNHTNPANDDKRPQFVVYGFFNGSSGKPYCVPISSRLMGNRSTRGDWRYYEETQNYRTTISKDGVWEHRSLKDGKTISIKIDEKAQKAVVSLPNCSMEYDSAGGNVTVSTESALTLNCTNATINASASVDINAVTEVRLDSPLVKLGQVVTDPVVRGGVLWTYIQYLIQVFNSHTHAHGDPAGSTSTPGAILNQPPITLLSQTSRTQ